MRILCRLFSKALFQEISRHHLKDVVPVVLSGRLQYSVTGTDVMH